MPPAVQAQDDYDIFRGIVQYLGIQKKNTPKVVMPGSESGGFTMPRANPLYLPNWICCHLTNCVPKAGISWLCRKHRISCSKSSKPIRRRTSCARQVARSRYSRNVLPALGITTVQGTQSGWTQWDR